MRALVGLGLVLALGACDASEPVKPAVKEAPEVKLATVALDAPIRVLGTEPFWNVEIAPAGLVLTRIDQQPLTAPNNGFEANGNVVLWTSAMPDQTPIKITLTGTDCSDGMSDRIYPLSAMVEIGTETLTGCAASVEALSRASEAGRVE
ncbi:COG3650 family protein [Brevundimonas sp.]|uniref:COG3650 family protein n=1 Tax=Brevundimonas sp. TaxID=1871086 RepID=UPI002FC6CE5C